MASCKVTTDGITTGPILANGFTGGDDTVYSAPVDVRNYDGFSLQLIADYFTAPIELTGPGSVDAATSTFTLPGNDFTGLEGSTITVSGAANDENNGSFLVDSVLDDTLTIAGHHTFVDETFGPDVALSLSMTQAPPTGTWKIEGSNDFATQTSQSPAQGGAYGSPGNLGHWSDITALFNKPAAVASVSDATSQIVQPDGHCSVRHIRVSFTPSGGMGSPSAYLYAKSWSA